MATTCFVWSAGRFMIKGQVILAPLLGSFVMGGLLQTRAIAQTPSPNPPVVQTAEGLCRTDTLMRLGQPLLIQPTGSPAGFVESLPQPAPLDRPQQPQAVTLQQTLTLTLPTALQLAFDRNPDLRATKLQLERRCAQLRQAKAALWPTLRVNGSISRTDNGSFSPANRRYGTAIAQDSRAAIRQQRALAQQQLRQDIQQLQQRFQQTATLVQRNTLDQQLQQLEQRATTSAVLADPVDLTPLTPGDVALPLRSGSSAGGQGSFFNGSLTLSYNIFTAGQREASIQSAQKQVESAAYDLQLQLQQLREAITNRYYDMQQTQALMAIADSQVKNLQENFRIIQLGEQAGIRTQFEVLQASVSLADALQNQTQAKSLDLIARRQLVEQLNLPETANIQISETPQALEPWDLSLEETIILALNNRVELNQTLLQRQIAQLQKRVVASQLKPQVQGFANLNLADDLEDRVLGAYGYSVGVQMNLLAFDGGAVRSQLRQLDRSIAITDQQFNQFKESIRFEIEQAYFDFKANATNIETAKRALEQAQEGLRLAELRRQAGVGTTLEVTRAQADLTQAQGNLVGAILDYNRALATLERATGYATVKR